MVSNAKSRVKIPILFLALFVLVMLVCILTVAISGLKQIVDGTHYTNSISSMNSNIHSAQLSLERTKILCKNLVIYVEDSEVVHQTIGELSGNMDSIETNLDMYIREVTNAQEMDMAQLVSHLAPMYKVYLLQMMESGVAGNVEAMKALMLENSPLVSEISANLQMMYEIGQAQLQESDDYFEHSGNSIIILLVVVSVVAIIMIIAASGIALYVINKRILSLSEAQETDSQYRYGRDDMQADGRTQAEFERCVADLKAVAYDLSQSVKELKR